jgi:hypothetical protein
MQTDQLTLSSHNGSSHPIADLDALVEQIWRDLDGQLPRARISQVAAEAAIDFAEATVMTFIPIFIRRDALEKLRTEPMLQKKER